MSTASPSSAPRPICLVKVDQRLFEGIPPLGLLYVGGALKRAGYPVRIYHVIEDEIDHYAPLIAQAQPLYVGFSVVTGLGMKAAADLARRLKASTSAPIVWGCVHPSQLPEQCLAEDYIDMVCLGEGEDTAVELAEALSTGRSPASIRGLGTTSPDGTPCLTEPRPLTRDLDRFEADWSLVDVERYITPNWGIGRTLRVTTSRGCPHDCSFCYNQAFNHRRWRAHSADAVVEQVTALAARHQVEGVYFNDDNFFVDEERAWSILERLGLPYYVCARAERVTEPFAARLHATGCKELMIGYESGSDRIMRDVLNKGATVADQVNATRIMSRYPGIKIFGSFMIGLPDETPADADMTIRLMCDFLEWHPNIELLLAFYRPLPGTDLYDRAIRQGFVPPATTEAWAIYDSLENRLELPWMTAEDTRRAEAYCRAVEVLAVLYKFNVPGLKPWARRAVIRGDVDHVLLRGLNTLRRHYAFGPSEQPLVKLLRRAVDAAKRLKRVD